MSIQRLDTVFAALLLMFGVWIMWQAVGYGVLGPDITDAGFFPLLAGGLLTISAAGTLVRQRREEASDAILTLAEFAPVAGCVIATAIYLLLVETLGMVFLTPFYVCAVSCLIEWPRTRSALLLVIAVALGFTLFAYLLFGYLLRVPLPHGPLGF